jgi:hypothetical protein
MTNTMQTTEPITTLETAAVASVQPVSRTRRRIAAVAGALLLSATAVGAVALGSEGGSSPRPAVEAGPADSVGAGLSQRLPLSADAAAHWTASRAQLCTSAPGSADAMSRCIAVVQANRQP